MSRGPKSKLKSQSERFKEAAREHGAEDGPDIDEVMRRLAAQKRHEGAKDDKPTGRDTPAEKSRTPQKPR